MQRPFVADRTQNAILSVWAANRDERIQLHDRSYFVAKMVDVLFLAASETDAVS
jgi:hypothetical protein